MVKDCAFYTLEIVGQEHTVLVDTDLLRSTGSWLSVNDMIWYVTYYFDSKFACLKWIKFENDIEIDLLEIRYDIWSIKTISRKCFEI